MENPETKVLKVFKVFQVFKECLEREEKKYVVCFKFVLVYDMFVFTSRKGVPQKLNIANPINENQCAKRCGLCLNGRMFRES